MNDGNTAVHVSPVTEDEMTKVKDIFSRALNSIADLTNLRVELDSMRKEFESLRSELDYLKDRNKTLDEMLANVRRQRDEAEQSLSAAQTRIRELEGTNDNLKQSGEYAAKTIDDLRTELQTVKAQRDKAEYEALNNEEDAARYKTALVEVHDKLRGLFPDNPTPVHVPISEPSPVSVIEASPTTDHNPNPAPVPPEVDWTKPYEWNTEKGYYQNVPQSSVA